MVCAYVHAFFITASMIYHQTNNLFVMINCFIKCVLIVPHIGLIFVTVLAPVTIIWYFLHIATPVLTFDNVFPTVDCLHMLTLSLHSISELALFTAFYISVQIPFTMFQVGKSLQVELYNLYNILAFSVSTDTDTVYVLVDTGAGINLVSNPDLLTSRKRSKLTITTANGSCKSDIQGSVQYNFLTAKGKISKIKLHSNFGYQ